jgi:hypothetical protein
MACLHSTDLKVSNQAFHGIGGAPDGREVILRRAGPALSPGAPCPFQGFQADEDGLERVSKVMGHHAQDIVPGLDGVPGFPVEAGVLHRDPGSAPQLHRQFQVLFVIAGTLSGAETEKGTHGATPRLERHRHVAPGGQLLEPPEVLLPLGPLRQVVRGHRRHQLRETGLQDGGQEGGTSLIHGKGSEGLRQLLLPWIPVNGLQVTNAIRPFHQVDEAEVGHLRHGLLRNAPEGFLRLQG